MSSFGSYLREIREARGVSLDEISDTTRVARSYLEALEREELAKLPAPVFIRGFIRAYCDTLGVPPDEAIRRYDESPLSPSRRSPAGPGPRPPAHHARGQVMVSLVLLVVLGAALLAITTTLKGAREGFAPGPAPTPAGGQGSGPTVGTTAPSEPSSGIGDWTTGSGATAPALDSRTGAAGAPAEGASGADVGRVPSARGDAAGARLDGSLGRADAPVGRADAPVGRADAPVGAAVTAGDGDATGKGVGPPYRLTVTTTEPTWIRVRTEDGGHVSEELIPAGQVREWVSNRRFALRIGNAGGVRLELNGRALPPLGSRGEVIERLVLPSGERR